MASTGSHLRELRERHGVSLGDLAQTTRISERFLAALEEDDFASLPAGPFVRGFVRSYCQALSESPEEPLALLPPGPLTIHGPRRATPGPPGVKRSLAPVLVSLGLLVILGAALTAVTVALRADRADDPAVRAAAPAATPGHTQPADRAPSPEALRAPAHRSPSTTGTSAPYRLVARASEVTWIRVRMDGGRTTEETIPAGEAREWISNRPFELRIGNAGGVSLELNGQPLPPLGARGTVILNLVVPEEPR